MNNNLLLILSRLTFLFLVYFAYQQASVLIVYFIFFQFCLELAWLKFKYKEFKGFKIYLLFTLLFEITTSFSKTYILEVSTTHFIINRLEHFLMMIWIINSVNYFTQDQLIKLTYLKFIILVNVIGLTIEFFQYFSGGYQYPNSFFLDSCIDLVVNIISSLIFAKTFYSKPLTVSN
jgi:hypothetical protein